MRKVDYLRQILEAYDTGRISGESYDAALSNMDVFCEDEELVPGYYEIDIKEDECGVWQLWESLTFGDLEPCIVTLAGVEMGTTWDCLDVFVSEYLAELRG